MTELTLTNPRTRRYPDIGNRTRTQEYKALVPPGGSRPMSNRLRIPISPTAEPCEGILRGLRRPSRGWWSNLLSAVFYFGGHRTFLPTRAKWSAHQIHSGRTKIGSVPCGRSGLPGRVLYPLARKYRHP